MITADLLLRVQLFASLPADERASLAARAADVRLGAGEWLIREGEAPAFYALLEGTLEVLKTVGGRDEHVTLFRPGDSFGEVPLLLGAPALASLRALDPARLMRLDGADFHDLVAGCPTLNAEVMRTMTRRVERLQRITVDAPGAALTLVGRRLDVAGHDLRDALARNRIPFTWLDPDVDPRGAELAAGEALPLAVLPEGTRLARPSFRALAAALGLRTAPSSAEYDVVVVGGGPAGLAAAVYGASEGLCTLLVEQVAPGGQAGTSSRIENYLGFPAGVSGDDLSARARQQAERFGAELVVGRAVVGLEVDGTGADARSVLLDGGERVHAHTVVLATGVDWRRLDVRGADRFVGRGVYYGAARTEALGVRGLRVHLVGGGNSAGQAAMLFAAYADEVTLVVRGAALEEGMSQYLVDQLATRGNVRVLTGTEVVGVAGGERLERLELARNGARETADTDALFVFIGAAADTEWLPPRIVRDERGYVCTGRDVMEILREAAARGGGGASPWPLARDPYLLETSVPGVFAAGDVRHGSIKRVASGVGEGSMSIAFVHQYLAESGVR